MQKIIIKLSFFSLLLAGCSSQSNSSGSDAGFTCNESITVKGSRSLGMDILDATETGTYADNLSALQTLHAQYETLHLTWTSIETTSGSGTTSGTLADPSNALASFNSIANTYGIKLALTIRPIDATGKTVPSDLSSLDFNHASITARFRKVIDFVLTKIDRNNLTAIMIGNEVDDYNPSSDTNFWIEYAQFLSDIKTYVNATYPGLLIGFTATANGWISSTKTTPDGWPTQSTLQTWANYVNVVGVTYYPLNTDWSMKSPTVVSSDFQS